MKPNLTIAHGPYSIKFIEKFCASILDFAKEFQARFSVLCFDLLTMLYYQIVDASQLLDGFRMVVDAQIVTESRLRARDEQRWRRWLGLRLLGQLAESLPRQ